MKFMILGLNALRNHEPHPRSRWNNEEGALSGSSPQIVPQAWDWGSQMAIGFFGRKNHVLPHYQSLQRLSGDECCNVNILKWPGNPPDLKVIKNLWKVSEIASQQG